MKKWFGIAMLLLLSLQSVYADPVRRVPQPPTQFNELTPRRKQSTQNSVSHINQISSCNVERSLNVGRLPKVSSELSWCCSRKTTTKSNNSVDKELDCEIKCTDVDQLAQFLKGKGCVIRSKSERFGMIHAYVLASRMSEIVSDARVIWVREVVPPIHNKTNTSAGDVAHKAATARSQLGVSGAGVKIGVISDSARYLTDMQSSGDLPSYVTVLPGLSGAIEIGGVRYDAGEGTAMMEIVHDLCPGASLYFATSGDTEAEMAESVLALRNAGCDIIVDDICFVPESAFQDGIVAQAVNEVTADGCIYVTCAANKGNVETGHGAVWEGDFKSCGTVTLGGIEYEVHGFGSLGNNQYSTLWYWAVGSDTSYGTRITLQWSDANGRSANDYALALYDTETSRFIQLSDSYQSGAGCDPFEYMEIGRLGDGSYWTSGTYSGLSLVILREKGAANRYLRLSVFDGASETLGDVLEFVTPGQVYGHNAAEHAICVAAAVPVSGRAFTASDSPAYYTSDGPRRMFYNASGAAYTTSLLSDGGKLLNKPDVMGASSVSCATPGFNPFSGTSAAAPHVAAIVGLMLEANGRLGLEEVRAILHESTVSSSGWNKTKGYGAVDAYVAVQAAKNAEPKLDFGSSSKTVSAEGGSVSVAVSANVSWTVSKSAGAAWLNLSNTSGAGDGSVNFTADRNNTTSARNATLTLAGEGMTRTCSVLQEGMTAPVRPVVTASDGSSSDSITVKWENCARALTYSLRRAESATGNKTLLDANATSPYVDVNVTPGKTYYYWVTAVNEIGSNESSYDSGYRSISLSLDAGGNVYTKSGGESSFSVSGNSSWTVTCSDEWITLGTTTGSGSGVVRFTVDKNFDGETRYGTIVVTSGSVSRTITVTQPGRVLVVANSGSITINTGASSPSFYVSSSGKTHYGSVVDGTAVYKFDYLEIGSSVSVSVSGSRPLVIESETDMKVACGFDVSGTSTGRCGGGVGGAGGSGGTTVTGGSGGSGGSCGSGGNGYTVSNYSGTTQGQSGKSGSAGDTGYNGSSGNYGTSGSSGGKGFGSTGNAASGGSRGSGGSAGSAASSVGSLGTGGYAGADGNPGGSGTKGNAGGAGNDGSSGSNGVNAFTSALTSDVIMAGAGGGGGGGGGSGGSGGGGSGGGGGGGGGGTSQTEAKSYSGNTTYINRGVYQGAIGGFGGTGGNGGKGATSGAGGSGGTGGHGGGAIVLKAAGVMKFTGSVDVSAANGSRSGSSGSSASSASSGVSGGSGTAGQGALNLQTFSSLYPSSGHKGGNGGTGGAGGNAGKGGAGGAGGYGAPGMVKLYASVLLASDGRVSGANGDNSTTASRCGGLTLATNMKSAALTVQKPTVATTIKCGERSGAPSLKVASVYNEDVKVPVVGQLKVSHADASGVCESGNYALSLVSSQSAEGSVDGLTIKRLTTLFDGYDQIFLINDSSAKIGPVEVEINGVACSIPELAVGEAWTTCVQAGVAVAGGEVLPAEPTAVTASDGAYSDKVLVSWTGSSGATSYNLYRSATSTRPSAATKTGVTSPYSDTSATPGTTYYYWVSAVNSAGSSYSSYNTGYRAVSVSIDTTTATFVAAGGTGTATVTANTSWSATTDASWITLTTSSGSGNGSVAYTVAASTSTEPRTGTITITVGAGTSHPVTKTITVSQSEVEDDGKMPDLAFAQFDGWDHGFAIFTVAQGGGATNTPLRVFDKGEGFSLAYGYVNFGEGVAVGTMTNRIELFDVDDELVYENDDDETIDFEQYWGRSHVFTAYAWEDLEPGAYIAQVSLDAYDQIAEEDEDNNVGTFRFAVRDPVSLNEALDNTALTFTTDVAKGWFGTKGLGADGVDAAQCTHIGHSSTNSMSTTVTGPGTISFKWKVSSENGWDELCFLVDGAKRVSMSGTGGDWDERSYELSSGTHTLTWSYCKDDSYSDGVDCGWVDQVIWTPAQSAPPAPTSVSATDGTYADKVIVSWTGSSGATSYNLYRSTTSTRPSAATKTGVTSPYSDTTATPGTKYYYWVSAVNSAGSSCSTSDTGYRAVSLSLGKSSDSYAAAGGNGSASVTANTSWSATAGVSWITLGTSSGSGNGTLTYTVAANTSVASRTGTITMMAGGGTSYPETKTISVTQEGIPEVYGITYANLCGATHVNPSTYEVGSTIVFTPPTGRTGYTFTGWTPEAITADMTGAQTVTAGWRPNTYTVVFAANGGDGSMDAQQFTYDVEQNLRHNTFTRDGYEFLGWAMSPTNEVSQFVDGGPVKNLVAMDGGVVTLYAVWEKTGGDDPVIEPPVRPDWKGVIKEDTMVVYAVVYDRLAKATVEAAGSLLAAFDVNGECRGVTEIEEGPLGMIFQLSIGVESATEKGFVLKVWNAETGEIQEIGEKIDCNVDKQIGEISAPVTYEVGALTQTIKLDSGWTWMSFAVLPEDSTIGSVLAGGTFANGDKLKAPDKAVTFYNGSWYPATYELKPGVAYMVSKGTEGVDAFELTGSQAEDGMEVSSGWNWIGSLVLTNETIASLTHSVGFANGDQVKSGSASTTWYNGKWYPTTFEIRSGAGYKAKFANAGKLYFGLANPSMPKMKLAAPAKLKAPNNAGKPDWSPVIKEDTMVVYACVRNLSTGSLVETSGATLAAFSADGECRGVVEIDEGPFGPFYQLSVGVESVTEKGFVLKLWDPAAGEVVELPTRIDANADKQIGAIDALVEFSFGTQELPTTKPDWKPVIQEDTFVAYLVISNDATKAFIEGAGSTLAAFSAEGECRGVTEIEEGPLGKLYQLSVGVASATESGFTLKLWDETAKKVLDVDATLACNAEKQIGEIFEPVVLMVKGDSEQRTPFPDFGEKPSAADVQAAVKDSADPQVIANIDETNYNDFRNWVGTVKTKSGEDVGAQGVMDSPYAWLSYALDSATLIQNPPADGDVRVEKFEQTATADSFDFTVGVENIPVGDDAKPGNLAKVFGVEGGSTLSPQNMSVDKVDITFGTPENGKVKFTAGPKDKAQPSFFMRVKMK